MQGIVKSGMIANVKNMTTSAIVIVANAGDVFYGDLSTGGTDLLNLTHYYKGGTTLTQLGATCKVSVGNLILNNVVEPTPSPSPDPIPTPSGNPTVTHTIQVYSDGTISIDGGARQ